MPFTAQEFLVLFAAYNTAVWPAQLLLNGAAMIILVLLVRGGRTSGRWVLTLLALLWFWAGAVYHVVFFTRINPAAFLFGALFLLQGALLLRAARKTTVLRPRGVHRWSAAVIALYALVLYPLIGWLSGHGYPAAPTFGTPCPTTIFTFAVLLWLATDIPRHLLIVPLLWTLVGSVAALTLGVWADAGLLVAGMVTVALMGFRGLLRVPQRV